MKDIVKKDDSTKNVFEKIFGDLKKASTAQQIAVGSISGWATGMLTMKVGKIAAISVGGGIILLQVAHKNGYITINHSKLDKCTQKITKEIENTVNTNGQKWFDKIGKFAQENSYFALSFAGGFLIGIAT